MPDDVQSDKNTTRDHIVSMGVADAEAKAKADAQTPRNEQEEPAPTSPAENVVLDEDVSIITPNEP